MGRVAGAALLPALLASSEPAAAELLGRLRVSATMTATATRPFSSRVALQVYARKAAKGDRPGVRTEGYPALLEALAQVPGETVIVHGVTFLDMVYLVFTDPARTRCLAILRKRRPGRHS